MAARVYATEADYLAQLGVDVAPANLDQLLRVASKVVDKLLATRVYGVTATTGMPTNPDDQAALAEATVAIAAAMDAEGTLSPTATVGGDWDSIKIGTLSLTGKAAATTGGATAGEVDGIPVPPLAVLALADVGRHYVRTYG